MLTLLIPWRLLVTVGLYAIEPRWGVIECDDLREGQLESAGARVEVEADDFTVARDERDALARLTHDCVIEATRHRGARELRVELRGGVLGLSDDGRPATYTLAREALREQAEALGATFWPRPGTSSWPPAPDLLVRLARGIALDPRPATGRC